MVEFTNLRALSRNFDHVFVAIIKLYQSPRYWNLSYSPFRGKIHGVFVALRFEKGQKNLQNQLHCNKINIADQAKEVRKLTVVRPGKTVPSRSYRKKWQHG